MYLVAGLGLTGQSVLRYFERLEEACFGFDTRADFDLTMLKQQFPQGRFAVGTLPSAWRQKISCVILSPGISKREPWVVEFEQAGIEVIGDIELFARTIGEPVIAITGSNGKSTVTTLVAEVLKQGGYRVGMGGNIGTPALDLLTEEYPQVDVFVLELSSFQLETTYSLQTLSSTVLNISEDHMDRYSGIEDYLQAKMTIFNNTELAVLPAAFPHNLWLQAPKVIRFGPGSGNGCLTLDGEDWLVFEQQKIMRVADMALQGEHHVLNAMATIALCSSFDLAPSVYEQVFSHFKGLPHRTQKVAEIAGVQWINDSKGTNVGATLTAIQSLGRAISGKVILLAGGVGKDADFSELAPAMARYGRHTVVFGRDQNLIAEALTGLPVTQEENLSGAMQQAKTLAHAGDIVLLSPACASFDQFKNYGHRGEVFEVLVKQMLSDTNPQGISH